MVNWDKADLLAARERVLAMGVFPPEDVETAVTKLLSELDANESKKQEEPVR